MTITRKEFSFEVQRSFYELTRNGMDPNEACALSLKLAAGMADPLLSVQTVRESLDAATAYVKQARADPFDVMHASEQSNEQAALLEDAAIKVHRLFSNPESLHAAFWLPAPSGILHSADSRAPQDATIPSSSSSPAAATATAAAGEAARMADRRRSNSSAGSSRSCASEEEPNATQGLHNSQEGPNATQGLQGSQEGPNATQGCAAGVAAQEGGASSGGRLSSGRGRRRMDSKESSAQGDGHPPVHLSSQHGEAPEGHGGMDSQEGAIQGLEGQLASTSLKGTRTSSSGGGSGARHSNAGAREGSEPGEEANHAWRRLKGPHEQVVSAVLERLDVAQITDLYKAIISLHSPRVLYALTSASEKLVFFIMSSTSVANPGFLRQLSILLLNPLLADVEFHRLMATTCSMLVGLEPDQREAVVHLLASQPPSELHRLVIVLQQYITITLYQQQAITQGVEDATKSLKLLYDANDMAAAAIQASSSLASRANTLPVPYSEFYNDAVNNEDFNLKEDFRRWKSRDRSEFSFCNYPYVYDPASKARVLQMENQMAQYKELHDALFRGLFSGNQQLDLCPFLVLKVRRGAYLVQDTLIQINRAKESDTLRKPLKIKFLGEEGVDEGGVQKEFFQLLVKELFNPDYGMFTYDETVRLHWFRASRLNMETEFELVGVLIGLAIYNAHILEFSFPLVLFKKLTGMRPCFQDTQEHYPDIHQNLSKLLQMSEDEIAACGLNFTVDMECGFGEIETVELRPGGAQISVTRKNCQEYVDLYTQHLLHKSIQPQYAAFERGFLRLCNGKALSWFRPQELELLACGGRQLDLEALESATIHDDGYTRDSQVVRWFWETVHAMDDEGKRRLLFFVTGSDRVPIKGLAHLNPPHVISKMGGDSDRLPTAHTCFNHLLLPAYTSKEMLQDRLHKALEYAEGFGLL